MRILGLPKTHQNAGARANLREASELKPMALNSEWGCGLNASVCRECSPTPNTAPKGLEDGEAVEQFPA